jgi:hypothetical protein
MQEAWPGTPGGITHEDSPMKTLIFVVSLIAALSAMPVNAQQGPAGVPGAPGLAPPSPPPVAMAPVAQAKPVQRRPSDCRQASDVGQCKARQQARRKLLEACHGTVGAERKQCLQKKPQAANCSSSADPQRCERHNTARQRCKDLPDNAYRQCLRDTLTTP